MRSWVQHPEGFAVRAFWGAIWILVLAVVICAAAIALRNIRFGAAAAALKAEDFVAARSGFNALASQGDREAQLMMAYACAFGWGGPMDRAKALEWLERAGGWGHGRRADIGREARQMAQDLAVGLGAIPHDEEEAAYWRTVAGARGYGAGSLEKGSAGPPSARRPPTLTSRDSSGE